MYLRAFLNQAEGCGLVVSIEVDATSGASVAGGSGAGIKGTWPPMCIWVFV